MYVAKICECYIKVRYLLDCRYSCLTDSTVLDLCFCGDCGGTDVTGDDADACWVATGDSFGDTWNNHHHHHHHHIFVQSTLRQASIGARWQNRTCQATYSAYGSTKTSVKQTTQNTIDTQYRKTSGKLSDSVQTNKSMYNKLDGLNSNKISRESCSLIILFWAVCKYCNALSVKTSYFLVLLTDVDIIDSWIFFACTVFICSKSNNTVAVVNNHWKWNIKRQISCLTLLFLLLENAYSCHLLVLGDLSP